LESIFVFCKTIKKYLSNGTSQIWEGELPSYLATFSESELRKLIAVDKVQPGSKIHLGEFKKEVSEILRENFIPRSLRAHIPILYWKGKPIMILLNLWNPDLNNVPKSWESVELL
jgi:tRNA(Ile)-lysidine synthetase-like protein